MNSRLFAYLRQQRNAVFVLVLVVLALMVAACQPDAQAALISPQLGEQLAAQEAGTQIEIQPTPEPLTFAELTEEEIYAGLPEDFRAALDEADPGSGESIALANGCVGCHALDPAMQMSGPTWFNLADTAVNRVPGQSPADYIHESIVDPGAYVVSGYPANVMPQNYGDLLSDEELADLVAYLLAQHGN